MSIYGSIYECVAMATQGVSSFTPFLGVKIHFTLTVYACHVRMKSTVELKDIPQKGWIKGGWGQPNAAKLPPKNLHA